MARTDGVSAPGSRPPGPAPPSARRRPRRRHGQRGKPLKPKAAPLTVQAFLAEARERLARGGIAPESARLEAELLLCHALERPRSWVWAHPERVLDAAAGNSARDLVRRRAAGEPVAYLTGEREFWSLPLRVTPDVLIPRPETELLVEAVLERMTVDRARSRFADIGTGSGAIALAVARERADAEVVATDVDAAALSVARANAHRLGLERVLFLRGSWCAPLRDSFDVIASNPPYVRQGDPHLEQGDCRFEPRGALTPGPDEFLAFREITKGAALLLRDGGWLLFEHGPDQGGAVRDLLTEAGMDAVETRRDLAGHERVTLGRISRRRPEPA